MTSSALAALTLNLHYSTDAFMQGFKCPPNRLFDGSTLSWRDVANSVDATLPPDVSSETLLALLRAADNSGA